MHVEYKCEVKEMLTPEEFKVCGTKLATRFPSRSGRSRQDTEVDIAKLEEEEEEEEEGWPVYVELTNGNVYGCDFVVSATGVVPNNAGELVVRGVGPVQDEGAELPLRLELVQEDGGVKVDTQMRTSLPCVYAAGDVCTPQWERHSDLWFQVGTSVEVGDLLPNIFFPPPPFLLKMRLWTQARQMGCYAAQCIETHSSKTCTPETRPDVVTSEVVLNNTIRFAVTVASARKGVP